jgi:chemotaxis signal transduction protein
VSAAACEILLFQVGARTYGAHVQDAVRIGSVRDLPAEELVVETVLGTPLERARGIVVTADRREDERTLVVDHVLGVRTVPGDEVRPLPAFAAACLRSAAVVGYVGIDDATTLLVDLRTLVRERLGAAAGQP